MVALISIVFRSIDGSHPELYWRIPFQENLSEYDLLPRFDIDPLPRQHVLLRVLPAQLIGFVIEQAGISLSLDFPWQQQYS